MTVADMVAYLLTFDQSLTVVLPNGEMVGEFCEMAQDDISVHKVSTASWNKNILLDDDTGFAVLALE